MSILQSKSLDGSGVAVVSVFDLWFLGATSAIGAVCGASTSEIISSGVDSTKASGDSVSAVTSIVSSAIGVSVVGTSSL